MSAFSQLSPEERDAHITSLLLGELPPSEAEDLRNAIAADPELARACERRERTLALLREAACRQHPAGESSVSDVPETIPARLSDDRREKLLAMFRSPTPVDDEPRRRPIPSWFMPMAAAALLIGMLGFAALLTATKSRNERAHVRPLPAGGRGDTEEYSTWMFAEQSRVAKGVAASRVQVNGQIVDGEQGLKRYAAVKHDEPVALTIVADPVRRELRTGIRPEPESDSTPTPRKAQKVEVAGTEFFFQGQSEGQIVQSVTPVVVPKVRLTSPPAATPTPLPALTSEFEIARSGAKDAPDAARSKEGDSYGMTVYSMNSAGYVAINDSQTSFFSVVTNASSRPAPDQFSAFASGSLITSGGSGVIQNPAGVPASGPEGKAGLLLGDNIASISEGLIVNYSLNDGLGAKAGKDNRYDSLALVPATQPTASPAESNINAQPGSAGQSAARGLGFDWYAKNGAAGVGGGGTATPMYFYDSDFSGPGFKESGGERLADDRVVRYVNGVGDSQATSNTALGGITFGNTDFLAAGTQVVQSEPKSRISGFDSGGVQDHEWDLRSPGAFFKSSRAGFGNRSNQPVNRPASASGTLRANLDMDGSYVVVAGNDEPAEAKKLRQEIDQLQSLRDRADSNLRLAKIDAAAPKSGIVQVIEPAEADTREKPSLWGRVANAFGADPERSVRLSVEPDMPDVDPQGRLAFRPVADPFSVQTEMERIQSTNVLTKVIEDLKLNEAWAEKRDGEQKLSEEETLARLKKKVSVRPVSQSSLVDIGVKSESPEEAARIANKIAEVYSEKRAAARPKVLLEGLQALEKNISEQDKQIALKREELRRLQKQPNPPPTNDIASKPAAASAPVPQPEVLTRDNAFSTFSLNVSDVSFKLAAASLEKGAMPDVATIRSEEFINAFDYRDPQPARGAPLAFAWDRARYPFAHNRDVVRFSVKTAAQGRESGKPLNIVLLLDNSGSMERADRVRIIQQSLQTLASQLKPQDKLSVVTFARTASLRVDGLTGTNALEAVKQIGVITPEGGTNLEDALDLAYRTALRHYEATAANRVVLLTDGAANLGNVEPKALKAKVEGFRKQGIALDCFGIGWEGLNDDLLEQLSRNGDGRYGFVNTPEEAASEFVGQLAGALRVAASDVKMQVEFNPRRVTAYRQIGYAKHQLTKEQFRDNKVDAAEIGAAESGNALYVIETNPNGEGPIATVRARFRIPQTSDYREHEWIVPFGSAVELGQANPALRLSAGAAAFSEWLASSPFAGDVTTDRLLRILSGVPETYGADPRPKRLEWMVRQAKSISGK